MSKAELDKLVEDNMGLVPYIMHRYFKQFIQENRFIADELLQEGYYWLVKASKVYDSSKGKFSTIAGLYIKSGMVKFVERYFRKHYRSNVVSANILISDDTKDEIELLDVIESKEDIPSEMIAIIDVIKKSKITEIEKIITLRVQGYSQAEIGKITDTQQTYISKKIINLRNEIKAV